MNGDERQKQLKLANQLEPNADTKPPQNLV